MYLQVNTNATNFLAAYDPNGGIMNLWRFYTFEYDGNKTYPSSFKLTKNNVATSLANNNTGTYTGMPNLGDELVLTLVGKTDGLVILNKALSDGERTELYNAGVPMDIRTSAVAANILGYWLFEDNVLDYSAGGLSDGTASGLSYSSDRPV